MSEKAAAEAAALKLSDFPSGWTIQPDRKDAEVPKAPAELAKCLGTDEAAFSQAGDAGFESPEFEDDESNSVSSSISYKPTTGEIREGFRASRVRSSQAA